MSPRRTPGPTGSSEPEAPQSLRSCPQGAPRVARRSRARVSLDLRLRCACLPVACASGRRSLCSLASRSLWLRRQFGRSTRWVPAFAGMTFGGAQTHAGSRNKGHPGERRGPPSPVSQRHDAKRADAGQHGRVSYGHGGAGDSGRAGDSWPKRLSKMRGSWCSKRFFGLPFWRDRKVIRLPGRDPARPRQRKSPAQRRHRDPALQAQTGIDQQRL